MHLRGGRRTADASAYPPSLCRAWAHLVASVAPPADGHTVQGRVSGALAAALSEAAHGGRCRELA
eukprot:9540199-Lingulodinium_polyedra.AAC.1